jgi:hypothetical protein
MHCHVRICTLLQTVLPLSTVHAVSQQAITHALSCQKIFILYTGTVRKALLTSYINNMDPSPCSPNIKLIITEACKLSSNNLPSPQAYHIHPVCLVQISRPNFEMCIYNYIQSLFSPSNTRTCRASFCPDLSPR